MKSNRVKTSISQFSDFSNTPSQNSYIMKCTTCQIELNSTDKSVLRSHYKSEFHSLNLKRKNSNLEPIQEIQFLDLLNNRENQKNEEFQCPHCDKIFQKVKRFEQHTKQCQLQSLEQNYEQHVEQEENTTDDVEEGNTQDEYEVPNNPDEPYLYLPNGTILGNKKYLIYFKQRDRPIENSRKPQTALVHVKTDHKQLNIPEKRRNDLKVSLQKNHCARFRVQWMQ